MINDDDEDDEDDPTLHGPICPEAGAELMEFPPEIRRVQPHMCTPLKMYTLLKMCIHPKIGHKSQHKLTHGQKRSQPCVWSHIRV